MSRIIAFIVALVLYTVMRENIMAVFYSFIPKSKIHNDRNTGVLETGQHDKKQHCATCLCAVLHAAKTLNSTVVLSSVTDPLAVGSNPGERL